MLYGAGISNLTLMLMFGVAFNTPVASIDACRGFAWAQWVVHY